jgi:Tyrosine phosphatase family
VRMLIVASAWQLSALLLSVVIVPAAAIAQNALSPGTSMGIASVPNLRDVGGYAKADGSIVRRGVAYRSDQLNPISPDDLVRVAGPIPVLGPLPDIAGHIEQVITVGGPRAPPPAGLKERSECSELAEDRAEDVVVIAPEIGNGLEVRL